MKAVRFAERSFRADPMRTAELYAALLDDEVCDCVGCQNFRAAWKAPRNDEVGRALGVLGIDANRPVEVYHLTRLPSGLHQYGGFFHAVAQCEEAGGVALTPWFFATVSRQIAMVRASFVGLPLVQIEFLAEVPWVLAQEEL